MLYRYLHDADLYGTSAYVGLALPGDVGSWQRECKVMHSIYTLILLEQAGIHVRL